MTDHQYISEDYLAMAVTLRFTVPPTVVPDLRASRHADDQVLVSSMNLAHNHALRHDKPRRHHQGIRTTW
ncbi:hypothetical protein H257_19411 [Aphanomyces astaci]|uniref:Uncharacterized protein n=1 Tax=Aphanomyces astaci TaxID=112090 RepID=W4FAC9_APHAT|nr:hypothetical protein H257_19410 [Aphanomyces astaci]XP_009846859.1 hypothetical protein H257_19411 [Aphanomyces astaci]ETV63657.1 hypothetical protein H257_19410 [Aphanomyces astaci]ETV63658.1 hypothetical protein H257_19411 [Aphanomyces astaci]|eukprot:XP_009846858.1 hypothetical protein H257_19410 [Aphanomyces astaci]